MSPGVFVSLGSHFMCPLGVFVSLGSHFMCPLGVFVSLGSHFMCPLGVFVSLGSHFMCPLGVFVSLGSYFMCPLGVFVSMGVSLHVSPGCVCVPGGLTACVPWVCLCPSGFAPRAPWVCLCPWGVHFMCPLGVFVSLGSTPRAPRDTHPVSPQHYSFYQCFTDPLEHRVLSNRSRALLILQSQQEALKDAQDCCTLKPLWPKVSGARVHTNLSTYGASHITDMKGFPVCGYLLTKQPV